MIHIQWKGKIGYGDIVSPICYAHNISHKLQVPVNLTFRWEHDVTHKIHPRDPETLWERAAFIEKMCHKGSTCVTVLHKFRNPLDINHTNYDWSVVGKDPFHNYWFPREPNKRASKLIVVNSTEQNVVSLKEYGKSWKDPAAQSWPHIVEQLKKKYPVEVVDYRTPVKDLIDMLRVAKGFVGYHGTAAWPAKFMHVPSILFSNGGKLTHTSFPYAMISPAESWVNTLTNIEALINYVAVKTADIRHEYKSYIPGREFLQHLKHG